MNNNEFFCYGCGQVFEVDGDLLEAQHEHQIACRVARAALRPFDDRHLLFEDEES